MLANTSCCIKNLSKVHRTWLICLIWESYASIEHIVAEPGTTFPPQFPEEEESLFHPNARFKVGTVFSETLLQMIESKVLHKHCIRQQF